MSGLAWRSVNLADDFGSRLPLRGLAVRLMVRVLGWHVEPSLEDAA
jgi:hypothetical protein